MKEHDTEDRLIKAFRQQLDGLPSPPDEIEHRLDMARQRALAGLNRPTRTVSPSWLWGTGGTLATASLVATLWLGNPQTPVPAPTSDFELLTADASLELLEDLDFATWLLFEEAEHAG
jgi:hypothetical protein